MNALKAFVVIIGILFSVAMATTASAATVKVLNTESVGLNSAGYWAGIYVLDINGEHYLAMNDTAWFDSYSPPSQYTNGTSWEANIYTQDDVLGGALVSYGPSMYSRVAPFFIQGLLGYSPPDSLWSAGHNEMVMNTMLDGAMPPLWSYSNQEYGSSGATLFDLYQSMLPADGNLNYQDTMWVINAFSPELSIQRSGELVVYAVPITSIPIPPAIWLFGSGLLGLTAVARRKSIRT